MEGAVRNLVMWSGILLITGCGGENTESYVDSPGEDKSTKSTILGIGADLLQDKTPLGKMSIYLDGFHFYSGNMEGQMEAHHYVTQLNEDLFQAIIFDGNDADAKIMGVEYIVTEKLFRELPDEEKKLWHSHHYEVKSGTLIAPGIPEDIEYELMEELVSTYGKTIHTWHTDQGLDLPYGDPMIMMGFTQDGQLDPQLIQRRDENFEISTAERREARMSIPMPKVDSLANAWEQGEIRQMRLDSIAPDTLKAWP